MSAAAVATSSADPDSTVTSSGGGVSATAVDLLAGRHEGVGHGVFSVLGWPMREGGVRSRRYRAASGWQPEAASSADGVAMPPERLEPCRSGLTELRDRPLLEFAIDDQVDPLVEEGDQPGDLLTLRQRRAVGPDEIGHETVAHAGRPVPRLTLVGAVRDRVGGHQQVHP